MRRMILEVAVPEELAKKWDKLGYVPVDHRFSMYVGSVISMATSYKVRCIGGHITDEHISRGEVEQRIRELKHE